MTVWTDLSSAFGYGTKLTSAQMGQLRDNITALSEGASGAPKIQLAAMDSDSVNSSKIVNDAVTVAKIYAGALSVVSDYAENGQPATSWGTFVQIKFKCSGDPTSIRLYVRARRGSSGVACYVRFNIPGVGTGSNISVTSSTYSWYDLGTIDMSGETPGSLYEIEIEGYTANASWPLYVRGFNSWWE